MRLDRHLYEKGYSRSRSRAANLIKMGFVLLNGEKASKTSINVSQNDIIEVTQPDFASLGSFKLRKAFEEFSINAEDFVCVDIGAAHGGFSEVLLSAGASKIYAVDVGEIAFPEYLRSEKIVFKPNLNARYIALSDIGEEADFITVDVSFVSLKLVLPQVRTLLKKDGAIVALIKPQFEAKAALLNKNGIIKNQNTVDIILKDISQFCIDKGFKVCGLVQAPEYFSDKNKEFLIYLRNK